MTTLRTAYDGDRFRASILPIDEAFFQSEQRFGVGRLERLVSPDTLAAYRRGWDAYRVAIDACDYEAIEQIGPKMIAALKFMADEVEAAGHKPLAPDTWEAPMADGTVLVVVRTQAEQSAVLRAARASETASYETTLPPDLAVTIRQQHEGRALNVWTLAELARLVEKCASYPTLTAASNEQPKVVGGIPYEGTAAQSGRVYGEGAAADFVRNGTPLDAPLAF